MAQWQEFQKLLANQMLGEKIQWSSQSKKASPYKYASNKSIKQSPLGADGSCTLSVAMARVEELVLSVTGPAANAFAQHVCSIRALAAGEGAPAEAGAQPCGVPAGLTIEGLDVGTLTAPQTPDTKAALLIGASINKRTSQLPEQLINFVTQLCEKGLLDLGAAGPDAQSLVPPLTGQLQQGEPDLKVVKISSNDQLEQFSPILASAATVTKISMKNAGISAHALDNFVENSVMQGGCSQCSELSLAGNPELANATLCQGAKFSSWPLLPVLNLNFGTPVYSTQVRKEKQLRKRLLPPLFIPKRTISPRQARDNHRASTQKRRDRRFCFLTGSPDEARARRLQAPSRSSCLRHGGPHVPLVFTLRDLDGGGY